MYKAESAEGKSLMTWGHRLSKIAAVIFAAAGMMTGTISQASANTGAGGLTILYASSQNMAHACNVIRDDGSYQAVVCSDIVTYEGSTDYYAYGRTEIICQTSSTPHTIRACNSIWAYDTLEAGDGTNTGEFPPAKSSCAGNCPSGRFYLSTSNWVYKIADAQGGRCSSNLSSSYVLWNVVWGQNAPSNNYITEGSLPDGTVFSVGSDSSYPANDNGNESSGHYFICP
jgi:hypothetical protein